MILLSLPSMAGVVYFLLLLFVLTGLSDLLGLEFSVILLQLPKITGLCRHIKAIFALMWWAVVAYGNSRHLVLVEVVRRVKKLSVPLAWALGVKWALAGWGRLPKGRSINWLLNRTWVSYCLTSNSSQMGLAQQMWEGTSWTWQCVTEVHILFFYSCKINLDSLTVLPGNLGYFCTTW